MSLKQTQPKVVQKLAIRTLVFVLVLGGIFLGIRSWRDNQKDPSAGQTADTVGWISAIQFNTNGQELVAIKPDLTVQHAAGWTDGNEDRDATWHPAGNFLFFISNRTGGSFQVFRWNPSSDSAEVRSEGNRGRSNPAFAVGQGAINQTMLLTSGGYVMSYDPIAELMTQVLPPTMGRDQVMQDAGGENGVQSQFSAAYGSLGNSFREAQYCGDGHYVVAVMKRDEGECLVVQNLTPTSDGKGRPPVPIAAGDHVEFDVSPANGRIVFSVNGFQWPVTPPPNMVVNGKVKTPFRHYVADYDPVANNQFVIVASPDDKIAFGAPKIKPDGTAFLAIVGPYKDEAIDHKALVTFPDQAEAGQHGKPVVVAPVFEPTWDPTGRLIAYARRDSNGRRTIFTIQADGTSERSITGGKGDFGSPLFSPQKP